MGQAQRTHQSTTGHVMHVSGNHRYGTVEMDQILRNYCGIFKPLLEAEYFGKVKVDQEPGTIV